MVEYYVLWIDAGKLRNLSWCLNLEENIYIKTRNFGHYGKRKFIYAHSEQNCRH